VTHYKSTKLCAEFVASLVKGHGISQQVRLDSNANKIALSDLRVLYQEVILEGDYAQILGA
jgi:hypothetical protein